MGGGAKHDQSEQPRHHGGRPLQPVSRGTAVVADKAPAGGTYLEHTNGTSTIPTKTWMLK
jgi:hypothetical protein